MLIKKIIWLILLKGGKFLLLSSILLKGGIINHINFGIIIDFIYKKNNNMKRILYIISILFIFYSCEYNTYEPICQSYFKINWEYEEPSYIDAGGVIPSNFYYNTYYKTSENYYTIYYEYIEDNFFYDVIYPYEIEVEVFELDNQYNDNVYFDLVLYPDGYIDYYHELKSSIDVKERTIIGTKEEIKNNKKIKYTSYKLPSKIVNK